MCASAISRRSDNYLQVQVMGACDGGDWGPAAPNPAGPAFPRGGSSSTSILQGALGLGNNVGGRPGSPLLGSQGGGSVFLLQGEETGENPSAPRRPEGGAPQLDDTEALFPEKQVASEAQAGNPCT